MLWKAMFLDSFISLPFRIDADEMVSMWMHNGILFNCFLNASLWV